MRSLGTGRAREDTLQCILDPNSRNPAGRVNVPRRGRSDSILGFEVLIQKLLQRRTVNVL
jgi:hypothetical protein